MSTEKWTADNIPDLTGKVIIITGANSGIGFESSKILASKGAEIVLACRNMKKAEVALADLKKSVKDAKAEIMHLDLASQKSIISFTDAFKAKYNRLDVLLNNAGIMSVPYGTTEDGFEKQFGTNHLGHFALTGLLIDHIKETSGARVVSMSSGAHSMASMDFNNLQYDGGKGYSPSTAYGRSKLANLLFTYELQRRFEQKNSNAIALAAHPGGANTNLNSHLGDSLMGKLMNPIMNAMFQSAAMGALPILRAATDPKVRGGEYYGPDGLTGNSGYPVVVKSNKRSHNAAMQKKLWQVSEKLTGISF